MGIIFHFWSLQNRSEHRTMAVRGILELRNAYERKENKTRGSEKK